MPESYLILFCPHRGASKNSLFGLYLTIDVLELLDRDLFDSNGYCFGGSAIVLDQPIFYGSISGMG